MLAKLTEPARPDAAYISAREALIPIAEKYADKHCGKRGPKDNKKELEKWYNSWSRTFHRKMDQLYIEFMARKDTCPTCGRKYESS